jgi:hypothetical protein
MKHYYAVEVMRTITERRKVYGIKTPEEYREPSLFG